MEIEILSTYSFFLFVDKERSKLRLILTLDLVLSLFNNPCITRCLSPNESFISISFLWIYNEDFFYENS